MTTNINQEDITAVMVTLSVPYDDAVELIKNGINVNYIKTGFKAEINKEISKLTENYTVKFNDIIKETLG